jgi:hypothetical protein
VSRRQAKAIKTIQAMEYKDQLKTIQAMNIEGVNFDVALDSLLDGHTINDVEGTSNQYKTYSSQVTNTYKKYNGEADYGNDQIRTIIDARTSFIGSEGISIAYEKSVSKKHKELIDLFLVKNKLNGIRLFDTIRLTELAGYTIAKLSKSSEKEEYVPIYSLFNNSRGSLYIQPKYEDAEFPSHILGFTSSKQGGEKKDFPSTNIVYIRTGGYGCVVDHPSAKAGIILTEAENYDKALKDMRRLNHVGARITPDFETTSAGETSAMTKWLKENRWKVGDARVGTAKFNYRVPETGAHQNLQTELVSNLKTISGTTGVPAHWLGWVDQMSNRATAQELYAMVYNGTITERTAIEEALKEVLLKMQEMYIEAGGSLISEMTDAFELRLPLIDFGRFAETVKAYNVLYSDEIISETTYRNIVPGIDPELEKKLIAEERKEKEKDIVTKSPSDAIGDINIPEEDDDDAEE